MTGHLVHIYHFCHIATQAKMTDFGNFRLLSERAREEFEEGKHEMCEKTLQELSKMQCSSANRLKVCKDCPLW